MTDSNGMSANVGGFPKGILSFVQSNLELQR